jgi:hypothetical protein
VQSFICGLYNAGQIRSLIEFITDSASHLCYFYSYRLFAAKSGESSLTGINNMFGFFKKKKKKPVERIERRKRQRRRDENDRRSDVRWEPEKENRRSGKDRRKGADAWDERS